MKIAVDDGVFDTYVAKPNVARAPVVVVLQEIFGINADIRNTCDALARDGFIAVAPDLFWRSAPGLDLNALNEAEWQQALALYEAYDINRGVADIGATIEVARWMQGSTGRVGVMGFCLGGLMTYLTVAREDVDAAASYYGGGVDHYLHEGTDITAPLLMHLGEDDEYISRAAQAKIKAVLGTKANIEIHVYPGCQHAFARHHGAHYDENAAVSANSRTSTFFKTHLG